MQLQWSGFQPKAHNEPQAPETDTNVTIVTIFPLIYVLCSLKMEKEEVIGAEYSTSIWDLTVYRSAGGVMSKVNTICREMSLLHVECARHLAESRKKMKSAFFYLWLDVSHLSEVSEGSWMHGL